MSILEAHRGATQQDTASAADRRVHQRVDLRAPASVRLGAGPWHDAGLTRNLSAGGALVELPSDLADEYGPGDPIMFEVRLPASEGVWPGTQTCSADAVVLRSFDRDSVEASDGGAKLVALRFVERLRYQFD